MQRAAFFEKMVTAAQTKFGKDSVYAANEHVKTHYGIELPSLALRFLFTANIFPLERMTELSGPRGSGKSTFGYELMRLFLQAPGLGTVVETENKSNAHLIKGVVGDDNWNMVEYFQANSLENAMNQMTFSLQYYKKNCPEKNIPYMLLWDSLRGAMSDDTQEKVDEAGHSVKQYAGEANLLSTYFGTLPSSLLGCPISFVFTNHEKTKIQEGFAGHGPQHTTLGGLAPGFYATYHIRVTCVKQIDRKSPNPYMTIQLETEKNNMGLAKRRIQVDLYFKRITNEAGDTKLEIVFDWDQATVDLLMDKALPARSLVNELLVVTQGGAAGKYNCAALGLKDASPAAICQALYANTALYRRLQGTLSIDEWRVFKAEEPVEAKPKKTRKKKQDAEVDADVALQATLGEVAETVEGEEDNDDPFVTLGAQSVRGAGEP
jgi:RecA/RadA recombinase